MGRKFNRKLASLGLVLLVVGVGFLFEKYKLMESIQQNDPSLYKIVSVADGDTIVVEMNGKNERVRLIGIDTPEKNHPELAVQCFALEAENNLKKLIGNHKKVQLEADPKNTNRDIYDRLLRFVYTPDGTFLNMRQVQDGYAFAYTSYNNAKLDEFIKAESDAKADNRGLWSACEVDTSDSRPSTNPSTKD